MKSYLLLLALPLLVACHEENDEPYLAICPVESPREDVSLNDLLNINGAAGLTTTCVPFDASVDAIDTSGQYEVDEVYKYPNKPGEDYHRHFIERLIAQNNAFKELVKRPDAGWGLAIAYNSLNYPLSGLVEESNKNVYVIWGFLELMIENDKFFNQLTNGQLVELYKASMFKYFTKEQHYPLIFGLSAYDIGLTLLPLAKTLLKIGNITDASVKEFLEKYVKNWDPFTTSEAEVLHAIPLLTGSDMKAYEILDVKANINLLMGTWKVKSYGYGEFWRDYEKDEAITFRADGIISGNWLIVNPGSYSIEGNVIKLETGRKDEGGMAIDYRMKVIELTDKRMLCYAWTTWVLSSWGGNWFILEKVE